MKPLLCLMSRLGACRYGLIAALALLHASGGAQATDGDIKAKPTAIAPS
ncbi:hypothetical protein Pla175_22710 [Pirellulimonas nuda]|uniref:Uncharacterized protein n=1 Tax=Pirellulimonas nuda TaxID=2528009 RepID=A0A518DBM7_9BACT|nr:hypothetical protein Pla175_22710 [Pirellulimonas nuda]